MRVYVIGRSEQEILGQIYPPLSQAGASVAGYSTTLTGDIQVGDVDLVLVDVAVTRRGEEVAELEGLAEHKLALVLPRGRAELQAELEALPYVEVVAVVPVDYVGLIYSLRPDEAAPKEPVEEGSQPAPEPQTVPAEPQPPIRVQPAPVVLPVKAGRVIAFTSGLVGGTGKSTLAGALAWLLAHEGGPETALLSLDNPASAVSHFKLARWPHLGLYLTGGEPFERAIQSSGDLAVGIAPGDLAQYDEIGSRMPDEPGSVRSLVAEAASRYEVVVVDLPPSLTGWTVHPLLLAGDVVVVSRPTVADQAGVVQALTFLDRLRPRDGRSCVHLVLNDRSAQDLSAGAFAAGLEQIVSPCPKPVATVPHNGTVRLAQNEGVSLPQAEGVDDVLKAVRKLARALGYELRAEQEEAEAVTEQVEAAEPARVKETGGGNGRFKGFRLPVSIKLTD